MYDIPAYMVEGMDTDKVYLLRAKGNSGLLMLIDDGDLVIIYRTDEVADGDMAVLHWRASKETAIRYVFHEGDHYRLETVIKRPALLVPCEQVEIMGKVIAIIRHVGEVQE